MRIIRFACAFGALALAATFVSAQQARPAAPTPAPAAAQTVVVPNGRIAMIYSDQFLDPKTGITRFTTLLGTLNREFQPRQTELQALQTKITALSKEIETTQNIAAADSIRQKREQLADLNTELKRKGEDAEAAYSKRRQDIFAPLQDSVANALAEFAKARGITVIIDGSQVPVVYAADALDITAAFVKEFNLKNP